MKMKMKKRMKNKVKTQQNICLKFGSKFWIMINYIIILFNTLI